MNPKQQSDAQLWRRTNSFIYLLILFWEDSQVEDNCLRKMQEWKAMLKNPSEKFDATTACLQSKNRLALASEIDETNELRLAPRVIDNLKTKRLYSPPKKKDIKIKGFRILSLYTWRVILNSGTKIHRFSRLQSKRQIWGVNLANNPWSANLGANAASDIHL